MPYKIGIFVYVKESKYPKLFRVQWVNYISKTAATNTCFTTSSWLQCNEFGRSFYVCESVCESMCVCGIVSKDWKERVRMIYKQNRITFKSIGWISMFVSRLSLASKTRSMKAFVYPTADISNIYRTKFIWFALYLFCRIPPFAFCVFYFDDGSDLHVVKIVMNITSYELHTNEMKRTKPLIFFMNITYNFDGKCKLCAVNSHKCLSLSVNTQWSKRVCVYFVINIIFYCPLGTNAAIITYTNTHTHTKARKNEKQYLSSWRNKPS